MPPLLYKGALPPGAMARPDPQPVLPPAPPPLWFSAADVASLTLAGGAATEWRAGEVAARPVSFNLTGTPHDATLGVLCFRAAAHAGLVIADALPAGVPFSLALTFRASAKEARTILTLQSHGDEDYLFLSAEDNSFRAASRSRDDALGARDPGGITLITLAVNTDALRLVVNDARPLRGEPPVLPAGPVDLFLGCRGEVRSLPNKIGCFDLYDVMIWPGTDVLAQATQAPAFAIQTWQERRTRGL